MHTKRQRHSIEKSRLENEVILSVVILYVLLSVAMLTIHHIQPAATETLTSSTSPSHGSATTVAPHGQATAAEAKAVAPQ